MQQQVSDEPIKRWVTFILADEVYGVDVMQVKEVLRVIEIAPVPGAPAHVVGIINLRGNVVTIIDTRARLGLPPRAPDHHSRIIVVEWDDQIVGFLVDGISEVHTIPLSAIESAPNIGNDETSRYVEGVFSRNDELIILVNLAQMVLDDEAPVTLVQ